MPKLLQSTRKPRTSCTCKQLFAQSFLSSLEGDFCSQYCMLQRACNVRCFVCNMNLEWYRYCSQMRCLIHSTRGFPVSCRASSCCLLKKFEIATVCCNFYQNLFECRQWTGKSSKRESVEKELKPSWKSNMFQEGKCFLALRHSSQ